MAIAIMLGSIVNAVFSFIGLLIFMPCMLSDGLGSLAAVWYVKRGGKAKLTKVQAFILGGLSGLIGSMMMLFVIALLFLLFGDLLGMLSQMELFGRSISGTIAISGWLVVVVGVLLIFFKATVSALAAVALSGLD